MPWMAAAAPAAGAAGGAAAGGTAAGAAGGAAAGGAGSAIGGGALASMAPTIMKAAGPLLGNIMGGAEEPKIEYDPTYGKIYERDPYAWQPGEQKTYQQALDEILARQARQEQEQQRGYGEAMNRRGLGASSIYGTGMARIGQTAQQALQSQNVARMQALQAQREQRAAQQRQMQHAWNVGKAGMQAKESMLGMQARAGRQQGLMGAMGEVTPFKKVMGGEGPTSSLGAAFS